MLTYCTNIHPGESWGQIAGNVWPEVLKVKERVSPDQPFPVGLRLSARAAREATRRTAAEFLLQCEQQNCFIPTINGFAYGDFHSRRVKELAYLPDWRSPERVKYTLDLVRLLQIWLPAGITGSISTVPIGYAALITKKDFGLVRQNLIHILEKLEQTAAAGTKIVLALEPEPGCCLETAQDVVAFFDKLKLPSCLRDFLGVCYDVCHAAVMFEEPRQALLLLAKSGIPVTKVHVSSAARITENHRDAAELFREPRYLHQTMVRTETETIRYSDVCHAITANPPVQGEWRVHFHLPIFDHGNHVYGTTNYLIRDALECRPPEALLEIETYTYDVIPQYINKDSLIDFINREFIWLRSCL